MKLLFELFISITAGFIFFVPFLALCHWRKLHSNKISVPVLVDATNTTLLMGGFGFLLILFAAFIYQRFPHSMGLAVGGNISVWQIVLLLLLIFLFPPQLMWFGRIRKSLISSVLIAVSWAVTLFWAIVESAWWNNLINVILFGIVVWGIY